MWEESGQDWTAGVRAATAGARPLAAGFETGQEPHTRVTGSHQDEGAGPEGHGLGMADSGLLIETPKEGEGSLSDTGFTSKQGECECMDQWGLVVSQCSHRTGCMQTPVKGHMFTEGTEVCVQWICLDFL